MKIITNKIKTYLQQYDDMRQIFEAYSDDEIHAFIMGAIGIVLFTAFFLIGLYNLQTL